MVSTDRIDGLTSDVAIKAPVIVATTANITLSGLQTIDGVTVAANDRVLVKDQTTASENGIYRVSSSAWARAKDFNGSRDARQGTIVFVAQGSTHGATFWRLTTANTVTIGTDNIVWAQAFDAATVSAFVATLLDDANASAFLTTLGISSFAQTLLDDATAAAARTTLGAGTGSGDASGPGSSTDNAIARFDGTGGKTLQNSGITIDDSNVLKMGDNTLERPKIKDYGETVNAIGSIGGGTQDIDLESGNVVSGTVDTSTTTFTFSNPPASGTAGSFTLFLTNGGSQTVNWPASVDWAGGTAPTLTSSGVDILTFTTIDGGTIWYGFAAGLDMQ